MAPIRIVLADDHSMVRAGLKALIETQPDMAVVGEASDGVEVLTRAEAAQPDLVVMDLLMPRLSGLEATRQLRQRVPTACVLILSVYEDVTDVRHALEAGASGYVLKRGAIETLISAIRAVGSGEVYFDRALDIALAQRVVGGNSILSDEGAVLSEREGRVLRMIAEGYSHKEIASQLDLSAKTVDTYKARAMKKLGLSGRVDIVRYASEQGWLRQPWRRCQ